MAAENIISETKAYKVDNLVKAHCHVIYDVFAVSCEAP